jgi:hypothetical protein
VDTPVVTWTENLVAESAPWKSPSTVSQRFSIEGAGAVLARDRESVRARRLEMENCILKIRLREWKFRLWERIVKIDTIERYRIAGLCG